MRKVVSKKIILLVLIIILGGFLRFFKLDKFPVQLNHDEMSQLYEVISIAQTGKDVYGNYLPVAFPLFGVYAPGHYIYLTTIAYQFFGGEEITIRIPAALMGTLTIFSCYLFVLALFNNWKLALLASLFVALSPSEIFFSRKSFEYMIGHFFIFFGLALLLNYIKKKRSVWIGITGLVSIILATYTYTAHTATVPPILFSFLIIFRKELIKKKFYIWPFLFGIIVTLPLIFLIFTNSDLRFRANTIFISKDPQLGVLLNNAKMENSLLTAFLSTKIYIDYAFNRYLHQFDPTYLFGEGLDFTNQGYIDIGPLYFFQIPLFLLGMIFLIKLSNFSKEKKFLISLILLSIIAGSLTFEEHSPHRSVMTFTLLTIVSSIGSYWLFSSIIQTKFIKTNIRYLLFGLITLTMILNFIYLTHLYTVNYPYEKSQSMHYPFRDVALYAWSQYDNFPTIIFDPQFGDVAPEIGVAAHYYIAYYGGYDPKKFQEDYRIGNKPREVLFDKFSIRQVYWPEDKDLKNTLVIASPWSVPINEIDRDLIIKRFDFYNGSPAFYAIKL